MSPLAGDINWMETHLSEQDSDFPMGSPLAGDINWMETASTFIFCLLLFVSCPHSLGTLIEWKHPWI